MKERELQRAVLQLMRQQGWLVAHFGNTVKIVRRAEGPITVPDKDARGFPDIIAIRNGRMIVAELKGETGKTTPEQEEWLAAFRLAGVKVFIWRPSDWPEEVYSWVKR